MRTKSARSRKRGGDRRKEPTEDKAWRSADWQYSALVAESMVPMFGGKASPEEQADRLTEIVRECPAYYPALFHLGSLEVGLGRERKGRRRLLEAVERMADREPGEELDTKPMDNIIEFLEQNLRYDVLRELLERLIERYPSQARFYDELGAAAVFLGDQDTALRMARKAVEMEPGNSSFLSNLGWVHLVAGRLEQAEKNLVRALEIKPQGEVARGNREALRSLKRTGGTFEDFLFRPLDRKELDRLESRCERDGDFRPLDSRASGWNGERLYAWKWALCRRRHPPDYPEVFKGLRAFFGFIEDLSEDTYTLYEDMGLLRTRFKRIMNKFIFKMSDADAEVIEEIYSGLFSFYGLLSERGLVHKEDYAEFRAELSGMKGSLLDKAARYGAVRHDDSIPEEEKERVRDELFEGDHFWPGI